MNSNCELKMNCDFFVLTQKLKENVLLQNHFLWLSCVRSCVRPSIVSF